MPSNNFAQIKKLGEEYVKLQPELQRHTDQIAGCKQQQQEIQAHKLSQLGGQVDKDRPATADLTRLDIFDDTQGIPSAKDLQRKIAQHEKKIEDIHARMEKINQEVTDKLSDFAAWEEDLAYVVKLSIMHATDQQALYAELAKTGAKSAKYFCSWSQLAIKQDEDIVKVGPYKGTTAIFIAAYNREWEKVKTMVAAGNLAINPQEGIFNGRSVLSMAAENNCWDVVLQIIQQGGDVNLRIQKLPSNGPALVVLAAEAKAWDVIAALLKRGVDDLDQKFNDQQSIGVYLLTQAVIDGKWDIVKQLSDKGVDININISNAGAENNILLIAALNNQWDLVESMFTRATDKNPIAIGKLNKGAPLIWLAAKAGRWSLVDKILDSNAAKVDFIPKEDYRERESIGYKYPREAIVWLAASKRKWGIVSKLIKSGYDVFTYPLLKDDAAPCLVLAACDKKLDVINALIIDSEGSLKHKEYKQIFYRPKPKFLFSGSCRI